MPSGCCKVKKECHMGKTLAVLCVSSEGHYQVWISLNFDTFPHIIQSLTPTRKQIHAAAQCGQIMIGRRKLPAPAGLIIQALTHLDPPWGAQAWQRPLLPGYNTEWGWPSLSACIRCRRSVWFRKKTKNKSMWQKHAFSTRRVIVFISLYALWQRIFFYFFKTG